MPFFRNPFVNIIGIFNIVALFDSNAVAIRIGPVTKHSAISASCFRRNFEVACLSPLKFEQLSVQPIKGILYNRRVLRCRITGHAYVQITIDRLNFVMIIADKLHVPALAGITVKLPLMNLCATPGGGTFNIHIFLRSGIFSQLNDTIYTKQFQ